MTAYYNEFDPFAAAWLQQLIREGHIAPGIVDTRDLWDVVPGDLDGFTQVHLCAGIGVWSYALRCAGWPDDRPVWTASFPCQPFSAAGKGMGFADERHLWPAGHWLVAQHRPECVFGEQVADSRADPWFDLVQSDVEALGYAFGCVPLASAGVGAPNPRHRAFWVADTHGPGSQRRERMRERAAQFATRSSSVAGGLADSDDAQWRADDTGGHQFDGSHTGRAKIAGHVTERGDAERLADAEGERYERGGPARRRGDGPSDRGNDGHGDPGPVNGFWRDADWLYCRDPGGPRWRPVDAGTFPLAPSTPSRVGALRGSGNAINAEVATAFIRAYLGE